MENTKYPITPLAERIRPKSTDDFFGQENLLGKGKPLRSMLDTDIVSSFILWGAPGTGKTTIALLLAEKTSSEFFRINAISSGVKEVREVIQKAEANFQTNIKTILFIDEIHRFNKSQQDALLYAVETGKIILIGATTENPSFEVIPALRSRMRIYTLKQLEPVDLLKILHTAIKKDDFISKLSFDFIDEDYLIYVSGGDARTLLNVFEASVLQEINSKKIRITKEVIENVLQNKNILYDKGGEEHYNVISAMIKSIRGSDPDAALYWIVRMLEGGRRSSLYRKKIIDSCF